MKNLERKIINYFYDTEEEYIAIKPYLKFLGIMFLIIVFVHFLEI